MMSLMRQAWPAEKAGLFAELLRKYRKRSGFTQHQLVNRLVAHGYVLAENTISTWEKGRRLPNDARVFHYLGICLKLNEAEEMALVESWSMEREIRAVMDYLELKEQASNRS